MESLKIDAFIDPILKKILQLIYRAQI